MIEKLFVLSLDEHPGELMVMNDRDTRRSAFYKWSLISHSMFLLFTKRKKRAQVEARDERNAERQVDRERLNGMWINTETKSMLV